MISVPRPEYPRPQWVRPQWVNLNGEWQFAEDPGMSGTERGWASGQAFTGRIVVPFCPESELSGIGKTDFMPCVWYRRFFDVPEAWVGQRVLLHFGAVDYESTVWVNGRLAGRHRGGYSSFRFDITAFLQEGENELVVRALDDTRSSLQPTGKQSKEFASHSCVYTRATGIWQTVWLEPAPVTGIEKARLIPDMDEECLLLQVCTTGQSAKLMVRAEAKSEGAVVAAVEGGARGGLILLTLPVQDPRAWSPEDPFLYELTLDLREGQRVVDSVGSYFGMRKLHLEGRAICLNNRPVYQRLVLDQGYYPDGIYTAPNDHSLRKDIEDAMSLGFNGARLHQKIFEPRFLYWADKLGYLVWGEYPNWGLDHTHPEALERVLPEWVEVVERDFNHPALVGWCPFNETHFSQRDALLHTVYQITKRLDPTRPVIDTSGYTHIATDIYDVHDYEGDPEVFASHYEAFAAGGDPWHNTEKNAPYQPDQPFFVSEYGGIWWKPGQNDENSWGYGDRPQSEEQFLSRYRALTETLLFHPRICAFCYTQLYDVEQEVNGLLTYDRKFKFDPALIRAVNPSSAVMGPDFFSYAVHQA